MKRFALAVLLALSLVTLSAPLVVLSGCTQVGLQQPRNISDELAYSYAAITSIRLSTAAALTAGQIKPEAALRIQALSDQARTMLDAAKAAHEVRNDAGATDTLGTAASIIVQLQQLITARGQ